MLINKKLLLNFAMIIMDSSSFIKIKQRCASAKEFCDEEGVKGTIFFKINFLLCFNSGFANQDRNFNTKQLVKYKSISRYSFYFFCKNIIESKPVLMHTGRFLC